MTWRGNGKIGARAARKTGAFLASFTAAEQPIAAAATGAIREAATIAKTKARAQIASAGFGRRWQNALRADVYPQARSVQSIDAAAHIYHRIHYATAFEEGATVRGQPYLWLALPHVADKIGRFRMTPARYPERLQFVRRPGKPPLLVASIGMSRARARQGKVSKLTVATMRKGERAGGKNRVVRSVPVFVGISTVRIRQRFNITAVIAEAADQLGVLYLKHLNPDAGGR